MPLKQLAPVPEWRKNPYPNQGIPGMPMGWKEGMELPITSPNRLTIPRADRASMLAEIAGRVSEPGIAGLYKNLKELTQMMNIFSQTWYEDKLASYNRSLEGSDLSGKLTSYFNYNPDRPYIMPYEEASQYGFKIDEGYGIKISPNEQGYDYSLISPTGWEIKGDTFISPEGDSITRQEVEQLNQELIAQEDIATGYIPGFDVEPTELVRYVEQEPPAELEPYRVGEDYNITKAYASGISEDVLNKYFKPEDVTQSVSNWDKQVNIFKQALGLPGDYDVKPVWEWARGNPQEVSQVLTEAEGTPEGNALKEFLGVRGISFEKAPEKAPPKEMSFWDKIAAGILPPLAKGLEVIFKPARETGVMTAAPFIETPAEKQLRIQEVDASLNKIKSLRDELQAMAPRVGVMSEQELADFRTKSAELAQLTAEQQQLNVPPEVRARYEGLPWYQQLLYEMPFWMATGGITAGSLRAMLAPVVERGGIARTAAQVGRMALAPVAGVEAVTGAALKYGVGIPLKYITVTLPKEAVKKAFDVALDAGLDKWIVRQGIRADQAPQVIQFFLKRNQAWLYRTAQENLIKNMAKRRGAEEVARAAAEDVVTQAEPLLLKAAESAGIKPPAKPEVAPVVTTATPAVVKPAVSGITPEVPAIPKAAPGMPEAGLQPGLIEVATEMGYADGDTLRDAILKVKDAMDEISKIKAEMPLEEPLVMPEVTVEDTVREHLDELTKMHDYWRNKLKTSEETKVTLANFIKKALPLNVRGKYLGAVARVKTDAQLQNQIAKVQLYAEQNSQKVLKAEIKKQIVKSRAKVKDHVLKGRFTPEVQQKLDILGHNLELNRDTARSKMFENLTKYDNGEITYEDMLKANEALNFAGINGMSADELANTLEYIKILETIGRTDRAAKQALEDERIKALVTDISDILTGGKGLKTGIGALPEQQLAAKPGWLDTFTNWQYGLDNLADKLSKFDKTSKPYQSVISKFVSQVHRASNRQIIGTKEAYEDVKQTVSKVYGVKTLHGLNQVLNGLDDEVNLGTFDVTPEYKEKYPDVSTIPIKMTRDELISKYMQMQDPTLNDTFKAMGWSQEVRDAVDSALTSQEKKLADAFFNFYENYYTATNEIYQELFNVSLPHNPRYSPIRRDFESSVAEHILMFQDAMQYASVLNGSLKSRVSNIRPLKFNGATKILSNHIEQMEHFKAWAVTMHDLRRVFGNKQVRQAIEQYHGKGIVGIIDKFMNQMAKGGVETAATNRVADQLRRNFTKSILAVKPVIAIKQIPSLFAYISELSVPDFFGGIAGYWKSPIDNFKFLYNNSELFRARVSTGFERDIRAALEKHGKKTISGQGKFTDWFMLQIRGGDIFAVTQGMWATYKSGVKNGLSQKEAIALAEDITGRTQPSFGIDTLSAIQNGNSWFKLMTMFQNQPNKYFRIVGDNLRNLKYGRGSKTRAIAILLLTWVVLPMMFQYISDAFQFKPERQARAGVLGPLNYILIGGQLVQSMWGWMTDEPFDYQISPVLQSVDDLKNVFSKAEKLYNQGQDPYQDINTDDVAGLVEYLAKFTGQVSGLPTPYMVQVEKLLRTKYEVGEEIKAKDFIFSQWAMEPPDKDAEQKVEDANLKLGEIKEGQEAKPLSDKELNIYTTEDWLREIGDVYKNVLPSDVIKSNASKESKMWAEYETSKSKADILPNVRLFEINTKDNDDTIINYYQQWQARQRITSLQKLREFEDLYPKARLGNVDRSTYSLLKMYLESDDKESFLKNHPQLKVNPRNEWLRNNPKDNAYLALGGDASILTKEAYNEFNSLLSELDIPDDAIPDMTLPPKSSIDTHFEYEKLKSENKETSIEAKYLLLDDYKKAQKAGVESYVEWHELEIPDKPLEFYKLQVDNKELFDKIDEISADTTLDNKIKDENGLTAKDRAYAEVRDTKVGDETFHDIERRVKAMGVGTRENPVPDEMVTAYVEHMRIVDRTSGGSDEAKLNRYDNPELNDFLMSEDYWGKQKSSPLHDDIEYLDNYLVPRWRINVQYKNEDDEYNAIPGDDRKARDAYLADHEEYRLDRRRRDALELSNSLTGERLPTTEVENFVQYYELPEKGYRQERFLLGNESFAQAMHSITGLTIPKAEDVPPVRWDEITEEHQQDFDKYDGMQNNTSEFYVDDEDERKTQRLNMLYTNNPKDRMTEFGKAYIERDAYKLNIPEKYKGDYKESPIKEYVEYESIVKPFNNLGRPVNYPEDIGYYEDDWYLLIHPEFYQQVYINFLGNKRRYFVNVPDLKFRYLYTDDMFILYRQWKQLSSGQARSDFERRHPELDLFLNVESGNALEIPGVIKGPTIQEGISIDIEDIIRRLNEILSIK